MERRRYYWSYRCSNYQDENSFEIQHISVNPSHRHQGVGKKMVKSIEGNVS